jgi:hypothetical protein
MTRRFGRLVLGVAILAGLGVIVSLSLGWIGSSAPETHADGAGPLASLNEPGTSLMDAINPSLAHATEFTFGMPLCLASGADLPVTDSVSPGHRVGTGYRFLGAVVREFLPNPSHTPIVSVDYFPPDPSKVPDTLHDIHGYTVTTRCSTHPNTAPYTELLIGMALVNGDGGGWQGVDVHYTVGGRKLVLAVNYGILICGTSTPQCSAPHAGA